MKHGFVKIACATPDLKVADCEYNADCIINMIKDAHEAGVMLCSFPELSITGYTCGDLFFQKALLNSAALSLNKIINDTADYDMINIVGLPYSFEGKIYNCAAVFQ